MNKILDKVLMGICVLVSVWYVLWVTDTLALYGINWPF